MKHLSIKAKITLWYTVLMALLVIVMLWILFSVSNTRILSGANTRLKNTVVRSFREIDFEDGMLEFDDDFLRLHPCYEYVGRCSCMFCMFMPERHAAENMKRYPEMAAEYVRAEMKIQHTWKKAKSLQSVFNECMDIDDIDEDIRQENRQLSIFDE